MAVILDLTTIPIDRRLLERMPLTLCQYHQVLPLAREGDRVSVAMVYPHNATALAMLGELLDAQIVPVQSSALALQRAFAVLAPATGADPPYILLQAAGAEDGALLVRIANTLAAAAESDCTRLDSPEVGAAAVLAAAAATRCRLTALSLPPLGECSEIVLRSFTSILLAETDPAPLRRILVVLRGLGADLQALAWAAAVAAAEQAELALLVLADARHDDLHDLLHEETEGGRRLADAISVAAAGGVALRLRIRQGDLVQQIIAELAAGHYEMLVLCAESRGEFVAEVATRLAVSEIVLRALLICKPNRVLTTSRTLQSNKRRLQRA